MHPTVAWILSRVGPSIRRVQRSSSYCTTVFVCITRLLAVVVSLKHCAGPPLLFISIIRQYCSTGTRTCYTLDICPLENRSVSYTLSRIGRYPSYIIFKLLTTVYDFCPAWRPALAASSYRVTKADPCWDHRLREGSTVTRGGGCLGGSLTTGRWRLSKGVQWKVYYWNRWRG